LANHYFKFKQFTVWQDKCAMKVTTDGCLFGSMLPQYTIQKEVLDIGTGTCLLSLMYVQKNPSHTIDAVELDSAAAKQATENVLQSPWSTVIHVHHADIKQFRPKKKYDLIFSNPPFYENELKGTSPSKNLAHHNDGLKIQDLLSIISSLLENDGDFYLLLPFKRYEEAKRLCAGAGLHIQKAVFVKQTEAHYYFRVIISGKKVPTDQLKENEISICDIHNNYTADFIDLLKDYYLYL
jgi:tRNA1Val (adenine37-N6)-methyltransferase